MLADAGRNFERANDLGELRTENLVKYYGKRAVVNHVSVSLSEKEIVGLLGPNGAGKTTTFSMICGIVAPSEGRILLDGQDITHMPMYKRARLGVGYLAQSKSIFRKLTVEQNIQAIIETLGLSREEQEARLEEVLTEMGLGRLRRSVAYTLSGGERRRTEIARALVTKPRFMLLDEPFSGVDPVTVEELQEVIEQLRSQGLGILITDHSARETLHVTDRLYIIADGEILRSGSAGELVNDPVVRESYLGKKFYIREDEETPEPPQQASE